MSASSVLSIDQQRRQRRTARHVWSLLRSTLRLAVPRPSRPLPKARPRQGDGLRGSSRTGGVPPWQRALRDSQLLVAEAVGVASPYTTAYIPPSVSARSTMRQNIKRKPVPPLIELDISQGGALERELDTSVIALSPPPAPRHLNPQPEPRLRKQRQVSRPFITDRIEWEAVDYDTTKSPVRGSICTTRDDIEDKLSQRGDEWIIGELCARWGWTPEDLLRTIQLPLPHRPRRLVPTDQS